MKKIFFIPFIFLFSNCSLDNDYIQKHEWKYSEGYWLHRDFIRFDSELKLANDTIFISDSAVAVIYETVKGYFGEDNEIHIKSIKNNELGIYHVFGLLTHQANSKTKINPDILNQKVDLEHWDKTPAINGRFATEEDVKNGLAIYYIKEHGTEHSFLNFQLPRLAYLNDTVTKKDELVVVIQIEKVSKDTVAGYRNIKGGFGACLFYELKFLDGETIKSVITK